MSVTSEEQSEPLSAVESALAALREQAEIPSHVPPEPFSASLVQGYERAFTEALGVRSADLLRSVEDAVRLIAATEPA